MLDDTRVLQQTRFITLPLHARTLITPRLNSFLSTLARPHACTPARLHARTLARPHAYVCVYIKDARHNNSSFCYMPRNHLSSYQTNTFTTYFNSRYSWRLNWSLTFYYLISKYYFMNTYSLKRICTWNYALSWL